MTTERSAADISGRDFPAGALVFEEGDPGSRLRIAAGEIAEVGELTGEQAPRIVAELLRARLLPEGSVGRDSALASDYVAWLELKRRFEPEGIA
jgi:hypothetical protein